MTIYSCLRIFACCLPLIPALASTSAAAKTVRVTQATIVQAMNQAQPGDTLVLAAGGYGVVVLPRKNWQTAVTIDARAAELTGIVIYKSSGVNWVGGRVFGTGYGVSIRDAERVSLSGAEISDALRGIVINNATDVKILRNTLHSLRTDGIDVIGKRVLVEGNDIRDMRPQAGDHPDGIQIWSANNEQTTDITVRGNIITGASQGIFATAPALGLRNIVVTGNKVQVAYGNGIVLMNTRDSVATGNRVSSTADRINKANMRVEGTANINCGNTVVDVPKAVANQPCGR